VAVRCSAPTAPALPLAAPPRLPGAPPLKPRPWPLRWQPGRPWPLPSPTGAYRSSSWPPAPGRPLRLACIWPLKPHPGRALAAPGRTLPRPGRALAAPGRPWPPLASPTTGPSPSPSRYSICVRCFLILCVRLQAQKDSGCSSAGLLTQVMTQVLMDSVLSIPLL
jgi:hypothetical protein